MPYFNGAVWAIGDFRIASPVFSLNDPAWPLFFELLINLAFWGLLKYHRRGMSARAVSAAMLVFIVCTVGFQQMNPGWGAVNFGFGLPRVFAEFFGGTLIFNLALYRRKFPSVLIVGVAGLPLIAMYSTNNKTATINSLTLAPMAVLLMSTARIIGVSQDQSARVRGKSPAPSKFCISQFIKYSIKSLILINSVPLSKPC